jgi:hypothetical protein
MREKGHLPSGWPFSFPRKTLPFSADADSIPSNYPIQLSLTGNRRMKLEGCQLHLRVVFSTVQGRPWKNIAGKDAVPASGT